VIYQRCGLSLAGQMHAFTVTVLCVNRVVLFSPVAVAECMCNWEHKDACIGPGCQFEMGLSWYHYSCKDCNCVNE
jgi:hypothetical protein